jgi:hypothetical protein
MSDELTKAQQLSEEMISVELSDEDLDGVAGGATAIAISNAVAKDGSIAISSASAFALDIDLNLGSFLSSKYPKKDS